MTFLAPWFLAAAGLAAAGVAALHLLARRRPPPFPLPTARFVPEGDVRAASRANRPADILLLALRVGTLALAGAAFARPSPAPERRPVARVVLLDVSRATADRRAATNSALRALGPHDWLVTFDSAAERPVRGGADATARLARVRNAPPSRAPGSLSAALVAASALHDSLAADADSAALVLVSPLLAEEFDAATLAIRAQWRGAIALVRVPADTALRTSVGSGVDVVAEPGDALRVTLARLGAARDQAAVRLVRQRPSATDSAWASGGGALVVWPASATDAPSPGWHARSVTDTIGGVVAGEATAVWPFARRWIGPPGAAAARWSDGGAAAVERALGDGCIREVGIPVPDAGDLVLSASFANVVRELVAPCGGHRAATPLDARTVAQLAGRGAIAPTGRRPAATSPAAWSAWPLVAALALLLAEPLVRRRRPERDG